MLCQKSGMNETWCKTLSEGAAELGIRLGPEELDRFAAYERELLLWNRRINLVSESSAQEILPRHFLDSLTPRPFLNCPDGALIDIGSGAGFPGIPLKIVLPDLTLTLVEASRKKSSFLAHIIRALRLEGAEVLQERVERLISSEVRAGGFDALISRAAFKLPDLIRMASFFLKPGGQLIAMKGQRPDAELAEAGEISEASGMVLKGLWDVRTPLVNSQRIIVGYVRVFS
jgi:16S rRNA (guanine527-N7)-methyltransferase